MIEGSSILGIGVYIVEYVQANCLTLWALANQMDL